MAIWLLILLFASWSVADKLVDGETKKKLKKKKKIPALRYSTVPYVHRLHTCNGLTGCRLYSTLS